MAMTCRSRALRSVAFIGLLTALAPQAFAQETQGTEGTAAGESDEPATLNSEAEIESGQDASAAEAGDITITGSRIRRPNLESQVPVTSVGGEEFFQTGQVSIGDVLNELPALQSTFSQSNSTRFLGTAGLNLLDLRGLGTQRTLVLVNGRRHVAGDVLNTTTSVDVNTIPTDLIERVDVVTGGNSAIYGSDAIAGVVNFVLKQNYEGIQVRGQGGISKYGDLGSYFVSALAGKNFGGGRGNVAVNFEYARQNTAFASGRPNLAINSRFVTVDTDAAATPDDGNFDNVFVADTRFPFFNNGGGVLDFFNTNSIGGYTSYLFDTGGSLIPQTGTPIGLSGFNARYIGGNGSTAREADALALFPTVDRYNANLIAHFDISDAFVPFIEAKFSRTESRGSTSGAFFYGLGTTSSPREKFFTENPFLSNQARNIIRNIYGDYYTDLDGDRIKDYYDGEYTGGNGINDADEFGFDANGTATGLGVRDERARRDTYRVVAGVRGAFNDDWSYEVSANYGRLNETTQVLGNVNVQRFLLAIDAVSGPGGTPTCRSKIDPSAAAAYEFPVDGFDAFAQARLAADVAACVPINLFGEGNVSQAARDYILQDTIAKGRITNFVLNAFMSGDTSEFFNLPGGPVGFALGAEYRRDTALYVQDELVTSGLTFYNSIPSFDPPSFEVKEVFGEIRLPILADMPFFHALTLTGAGRLADYKGATGTVFAYNAGVEWAPVRDLRFRANYSKAVRAPNLSDLYTPLGQNFAFINDPCGADFIATGSETANRTANCAAAGLPADFDPDVTGSTTLFQSGGNPDLREETSKSFTVGGVLQPRFIPGLSISVDYYDITVNDVITSPTAQQIINACYDLASLENQFCDVFERAGPTGGPRGEGPFELLQGSLRAVPFNYAKLKVRGIDAEIAYRKRLGTIGTLSTRVNYTHQFQNDDFLNPVDTGRANQLLLELGVPQDKAIWNVDLKSGPITLGYQMRYIGKMTTFAYESFFSKQGRPPQNADQAEQRFYPAVFYHDARIGIDAGDRFNFYMGVDNILNRVPPLGLTGVGGGSGIYSNRGRFFYAGATAKF
jgi:outer membrane receptor protein involved in Fe transport